MTARRIRISCLLFTATAALSACEAEGSPSDGAADTSSPTCQGCSANAMCIDAACVCNEGYEGDGQSCGWVGIDDGTCSPACTTNASCVSSTCQCDEGYFGNGNTGCYPEETDTGRCVINGGGSIECTCNDGYAHAHYLETACSDIDECELPDQGGCEAWCTNTPGSLECTSTVADESSPCLLYTSDAADE